MRELGSRDEDRQLSSVQEPVEGITLTLDVHETGDFIKAQAKLWGDVIRAAHITIEP